MENFFSHIPVWITVVSVEIVGLVALFGIFDKNLKERRKEKDELDQGLINGFKEQVAQLENRIFKQQEEFKLLRDNFITITSENSTLKELIKERDKDSLDYKKKAMDTMQKADKIFQMTVDNSTVMVELSKSVQNLYKVMEKTLKVMERNAKGGAKK